MTTNFIYSRRNKYFNILFILIVLFGNNTISKAQKDVFLKNKTYLFDWNRDGVNDTFHIIKPKYFLLKQSKHNSCSNIIIKMSNNTTFNLAKNKIINKLLGNNINIIEDRNIVKFNLLPNYFFRLINLHEKQIFPLLLIVIENDITSQTTPTLAVIALNSNSVPTLSFTKTNFEIIKLIDLNNDETKEIVGMLCYSQYESENILTYDPKLVYRYLKDQLFLDLELSKYYNEKYGYGWAGPECSEEFVVLKNPTLKKPKILRLKEAIEMDKKLK